MRSNKLNHKNQQRQIAVFLFCCSLTSQLICEIKIVIDGILYQAVNFTNQKQQPMRNNQFHSNTDIRKKIQDYSYGLNDNIGRGFSSVVFRGLNERTQQQVAIKVIDIKSVKDKTGRQMLEGEIQALRKFNHQNIMKCYDIYSTVNNCYIITEFCNEGDLENLLKKRGKISQTESIPIFRDIYLGYKCIAQSGFLHRDIKPANIFLKDKVAKIGDFGFAKKITANSKQAANVGSPLYMSPQALKSNIYTVKNDIWSLGVLLFEMLHGKAPWQCGSQKELIQKIVKNTIVFGKGLSEEIKDFIRRCLTPEEDKRMSLNQMSSHPFIRKIMEDDIPKLLRKQTTYNSENPVVVPQQQQFVAPLVENTQCVSSESLQSLHHRKNNPEISRAEKQLIAQVNWMKYLYRMNQFFPCVSKSGRYTLGLRYIIGKQLMCQVNSISASLRNIQNCFNFNKWQEFVAEKEKVSKYIEKISENEKKCHKMKENLEQWGKAVVKDKRLSQIVDFNFSRTQNLSVLAVFFALEECKSIWNELKTELVGDCEISLSDQALKQAYRLDFVITYYQLNCLLLDSFHDPDLFSRNSKIDIIVQHAPHAFQRANIRQIESKLHVLEIIK